MCNNGALCIGGKGELLSNSPEPNDYPYGKLKIDTPSSVLWKQIQSQ